MCFSYNFNICTAACSDLILSTITTPTPVWEPVDVFNITGNFLSKQRNLKELKTSSNNIKEINNLINIHRYFLKKNPGINFFLDLCEIDEKNYHDGIRFTIFAENVRGEIAKGGRYTSLNEKS